MHTDMNIAIFIYKYDLLFEVMIKGGRMFIQINTSFIAFFSYLRR